MRKSGKTTRVVDHAIQMLFKHGEIHIPNKSEIEKNREWRGRIPDENIIIDWDWDKGISQEHLYKLIARRLQVEHSHNNFQFSVKSIKLKQ